MFDLYFFLPKPACTRASLFKKRLENVRFEIQTTEVKKEGIFSFLNYCLCGFVDSGDFGEEDDEFDFMKSELELSYQNQSDLHNSRQSLVTRERSSVRQDSIESIGDKTNQRKRTLLAIALIISYMVECSFLFDQGFDGTGIYWLKPSTI